VADQVAIAATITASPAESLTEQSIDALPTEPAPPSWEDLGLHPDVKLALDDMGYFAPTPVQTAVYKPVSEGKDLLVQSRTGTGKTTAFGLPVINNLVPTHRAPQAMILCPTRELALQVARELTQIGKHRGVLVETLYGGAPIGKQITSLRSGVHVVVGTPGRVLDHIGRRTLDCSAISTFILDECDEMLSMGFLEDIERIASFIPEKKQTLLFSATMPEEVARYSRRHMRAPEQISLSRDSISVTDIHHAYYIVSGIARSRDLLKILFAEEPESAIIFCNMRDETTMVAKFLQKQGLDAEPLSSDLSQADRERVMNRMKAKTLRFLCATDVAARGIDISSLSHVINYSVPEQPEIYVHRTGRTGRMGKKGTALSLVGPRELGNFRYVRLTFGIKPEERLLPKDDIFVGKLKVPLPPVGVPQAPDPVQILIRGVTGTASELERQIFEKLLASQSGKRVLAALVAEKLDKLSTRSKPKRERPALEEGAGEPRGEDRGGGDRGGDRPRFDGPRRDGERPRFGGDRGDRPRFDREGGGGDRPRFDRDRGERPARTDGPRTDAPRTDGPRTDGPSEGGGERPRFDRDGERPRRDYNDRGDRPARTDGPRTDGPRTDGPRTDGPSEGGEHRGDRGERRFDRDDRGGRDRGGRDRDRGGRDRGGRDDRPDHAVSASSPGIVLDSTLPPTELIDPVLADAPVVEARTEERTDRPDRDRDRGGDRDRSRDRGDRGGRDRHGRDRDRGRDDRGDRGARDTMVTPMGGATPIGGVTPITEPLEAIAEVGTEAGPAVETETAPKVDDVVRAALERADRGDRKSSKKKTEPTAETREFWETWADEKSTREPAPAAKAVEPDADAEAAPAADEPRGRAKPASDRGGRGRSRDRGRSKPAEKSDDDKPAGRTKRDTTPAPPPTMADSAQARLFVSLGKKHGVSADDLRELLAGPIGGDKAKIGSVSLRDSHAHVRVPEEHVDQIISGVHGTQHNEHDVTVERSRV
jgi:ATP-dependent RNA helicase DeaD